MRSLVLGLLASTLLLAAPAHAAQPSGTMTRYAWSGVHRAETLAHVEAACACAGSWFGDGWPGRQGRLHRIRMFDGPNGYHGVVYFRRWDDRSWHVNMEKQWWDPGNIPVDQVNWTPRHL